MTADNPKHSSLVGLEGAIAPLDIRGVFGGVFDPKNSCPNIEQVKIQMCQTLGRLQLTKVWAHAHLTRVTVLTLEPFERLKGLNVDNPLDGFTCQLFQTLRLPNG